MKHFLFQEELTRYYENESMPFIKYPTCLSHFKGTWFFSTYCREIFKF